jgi:hypothetical protein
MVISTYRQIQQFIVFNSAQQCYMFRSIRPSAGTNVHDLKHVKWVTYMLESARNPQFYYYRYILILYILFFVSYCS